MNLMAPALEPRFLFSSSESVERYRPSDIVFAQGEAANAIFYIRQGGVKVSIVTGEGKEAAIAVLGVGDFIGEECLTQQANRMVSVQALADCRMIRLDKTEAIRLLAGQTAFARMFVDFLLRRKLRIEEDLVDQLVNSSEKRLARRLILLAKFAEQHGLEAVIEKTSQETLASMIGTTRSRVNYFISKFKKSGYIETSDGLRVNDKLLSAVL